MSRYEKSIIHALLDKYERSRSFTGDNKVAQRFVVKVPSLFPKYVDHANFEVFQAVNEAVDVLVRKGLITAKIDKAHVCSEVQLIPDAIDEAYGLIKRVPKRDLNNAVVSILESFKDRNEILRPFYDAQLERIRTNKSVQFFNNDLNEFEHILLAVDELLKVDSETFSRDFSIRVFKDSKRFDGIRSKVINLLFEYGDFPEKNQVLENLNIIRNPTYVNFKGAGAITLSGQRIDLSLLNGDIAISSAMLEQIDRIEITGESVMTVENLTSFNTAIGKGRFLIYLGGFHNQVRREFIKRIHRQNPGVPFYHFGDIDAGGFYIFKHLKDRTGIDFKPYKMDLGTLKAYEQYAKTLTENDRSRLKKLLGGEFDQVIDYMLSHHCKLEQEAVDFER